MFIHEHFILTKNLKIFYSMIIQWINKLKLQIYFLFLKNGLLLRCNWSVMIVFYKSAKPEKNKTKLWVSENTQSLPKYFWQIQHSMNSWLVRTKWTYKSQKQKNIKCYRISYCGLSTYFIIFRIYRLTNENKPFFKKAIKFYWNSGFSIPYIQNCACQVNSFLKYLKSKSFLFGKKIIKDLHS